MKGILSGTAVIVAMTIAASSAWAAVMLRPLGGPYVPENAPSPPSTILEPAPSYYPPATIYSYPYGYRYRGPYPRRY